MNNTTLLLSRVVRPVRGIAMATGVALVLPAAAQEPARPPAYLLDLLVSDAVAQVRVNGFPLAAMPEEGNTQQSRLLLSPFILRGMNVMEVLLGPQNDAEGKAKPSHLFNLAIRKVATGGTGEEPPALVELERTQNSAEPEPNARAIIRLAGEEEFRLAARGATRVNDLVLRADLPSALLTPASGTTGTIRIEWTATDAVLTSLPWVGAAAELQDADRAAIGAAAVAVRNALAAKNYAALASLLEQKFGRTADSTGTPRQEVAASDIANLTQALSEPDFAIEALDASQLEYRTYADLNLVRVLKDNGPPIRGQGTEIVFSLDLYFSKIDDQWVIIE